ncbi:hypothetical protein ACJIZ3_021595 [Penstemon smallii]|uniref:Uncharacterized protein n=1 Tax=Penstemon smallii TaxID=265156 RepID=A0ABD3SMI3_9LAMI
MKSQRLHIGFWQSTRMLVYFCYHNLLLRINSFFIHIFYFISLSFLGFVILKVLNRRTAFKPRNIDLFFTSVSASTVSSMSTVEMEVFSNAQLVVITILMFIGGEVFTSMVELFLKYWSKIITTCKSHVGKVASTESKIPISFPPPLQSIESQNDVFSNYKPLTIKYESINFLGSVVLCYLLIVQIFGVVSILIYLSIFSSAKDVLTNKGINSLTFAVFTIVSTFASCGFVPTNENMIVFKKNSGLLWIIFPQVLFGNTLFPSCLRFLIWVLGKKIKKQEAKYLLKNTNEVGYPHLLSSVHSIFLVPTVFGLIFVGFALFSCLEWNSSVLDGLNTYQKVVGVLFQSVNARHSGESIVDLSTIAPAILVLFIVMMYLPPYTSFIPVKDKQNQINEEKIKKRKNKTKVSIIAENLIFSQLGYLVIFIILICITERQSLKQDPINFNVLNITFEVISAYGNVGFSTGYSCERQIKPNPNCVNKWYGFSGKWSDQGKIILIIVMIFGRLKKFNMNGGRAWKLI